LIHSVHGTDKFSKKPNPEIVIQYSPDISITTKNILVFGDSGVDIKMEKFAKARSLGVLTGFGNLNLFTKLDADIYTKYIQDYLVVAVDGGAHFLID
jgi:phosphoglycolate phosphatase-like HAD superfamily hydrolase